MRTSAMCVVSVMYVFIIVPVGAHSGEGSGEGTQGKEPEEYSSSEDEQKPIMEHLGSPSRTGSLPSKESSNRFFSRSSIANIPGQLASVTEKARKSIYNAAGVLYDTGHPAREDISRQAYNTAGALYQSGRPMRKSVAESKAVKTGGIVWQIWKQLELKGKTNEERVKILVQAISEEIVKHVPVYTKLNPLEIKDNVKFICGVKGLIKDLTTMKKVDTIVEPIEDDGLRVKIDYTFTDLHFNYTKFHIHGLGIKKLSADGYLDLQFAENNVRITLHFPKFTKIVTNLMQKDCIVHVKNFEVTNLVFFKKTLSGRKDSKRRKFLSGRIKSFLSENQELLRATFEQQALESIHLALVTRDSWICKGNGFGDLVKSKGGSLDAFMPQNPQEFKQYCGTDYYIEPYKNPIPLEDLDSSYSS